MDRHDKRHSKHHKEKHKKRTHKKSRSHSSGNHESSYATKNSTKPLVEYSDVSSEALSAPEAGEIDSEASSIGRHVADDLTRKSHSIRTFVDNKTISVTTTSRRGEYSLPREVASARKRRSLEYEEPDYDDMSRYKKKKEKRKKDKKKKKKKSKHQSRSASLESVSPDDNVPEVTPVRTSPQRYEKVPISEWEKPSSPLRNGSCSPVSPTTPPILRHDHRAPIHREPSIHHNVIPYSPHVPRSPVRLVFVFTLTILTAAIDNS